MAELHFNGQLLTSIGRLQTLKRLQEANTVLGIL